MNARIETIQELLDSYHLTSGDVTEQHGAAFIRNDETPGHSDGNHVRRIRAPADADAASFLAAVDEFYAHLPYRSVRIDPLTTPTSLEAKLLLRGYEPTTEIVMATDGPLSGRAASVELITADDAATHAELQGLFTLHLGEGDGRDVGAFARRRGDLFEWYLALMDGRAVGHLSQRTMRSLGYLESLFVDPAHRHRGVATALVHHAAARARAQGAATVFLPTAAHDTPKEMYARMGFRPVYVFRKLPQAPRLACRGRTEPRRSDTISM